jgi:hypothetical protein
MKNGICWVTAIIMVLGLGVYANAASGESSSTPIISATPMVKLANDAKITIVGTGFKPGEEIVILYTDPNGVMADVGYALKPEPKVDSNGEWSTTWNCGRYVKKKLIREGVISITVADGEYNILAHDTIAFQKDDVSTPASPPLVVATPMVKMANDAKVAISGEGFKPGEEIVILYTDPNGVTADIGYALKPEPKADSNGGWSTTWNCGRYIKKKLIREGVRSITVVDGDEYNILAHDSIYFYAQ